MSKNDLSEQILDSWLKMSAILKNERLVKALTFQEVFVCNILTANRKKGQRTTASDIASITGMLKSQVNKVLVTMEKKELITRTRATEDQRVIWIEITKAGVAKYKEEHSRVLGIMESLVDSMGESAQGLADGLAEAVRVMDSIEFAEQFKVN